jgi:hypothetical protein
MHLNRKAAISHSSELVRPKFSGLKIALHLCKDCCHGLKK